MKKTVKRTLALLLAVLMLCGAAPLTMPVGAADTPYKQGDIIEFGSYPQTKVNDPDLIAALNAQPQTWISYGYYSGAGEFDDGQMTASDYMQYCDVTYGGQMYRGVHFTQYRPYATGGAAIEESSNQHNNGYVLNTTYWFRFEPLQWRVLDPNAGLVLCETIIDSQALNNYDVEVKYENEDHTYFEHYGSADRSYFANNYVQSSVRQWLTVDFHNTAFSASEQAKIIPTTLDNSAYNNDSRYNCESTTDKVFLLSYAEATNASYFSSDSARLTSGSDYAKCQGLYFSAQNGYAEWRLRTPGFTDDLTTSAGYFETEPYGICPRNTTVFSTVLGIRPALRLDLNTFTQIQTVTVTTEVSTDAGSTVTGAGTYNVGDTVTLTATAKGKETFDAWYVGDRKVSTDNPYSFTAAEDVTVRAIFKHPAIGSVTLADCTVQAKQTVQLTPAVQANGAAYTLTYTSSDPKVATVDANGKVTALKKGTTTITVIATDELGNTAEGTCTVTVKYAFWQILIRIFLLGFIWY